MRRLESKTSTASSEAVDTAPEAVENWAIAGMIKILACGYS
jgi:hypothetical protein